MVKRHTLVCAHHVNTYVIIKANQMGPSLSPLSLHQTLCCFLRIFPPIWLHMSSFKMAVCACFNQTLFEKGLLRACIWGWGFANTLEIALRHTKQNITLDILFPAFPVRHSMLNIHLSHIKLSLG